MTLKGTHVYTSMTTRKFTLGDFEISAQIINDNPWFVGKDVARSLGYSKTRNAVSRHVSDKDKMIIRAERQRGKSTIWVDLIMINEFGLLSLTFGSELPQSETFGRWICNDVLPALRNRVPQKLTRERKDNAVIRIVDERTLHHHVVDYIRRFHPYVLPLMIAGLGELQRTKALRIESWKKGYQRGQPDLVINLPQNKPGFSKKGLVIELKTPLGCGKVSTDQLRILREYESVGYETMVSFDYLVIIRAIEKYMSGILPSSNV